ncbi:DNA-binding protein HU-beta [Gammaproteobacteria bacterium]
MIPVNGTESLWYYEGMNMNKSELVDKVAEKADLSKASAGKAVDALVEAVAESLQEGESVTLIGFGTFSVRERAGRSGRNPRTGEILEIKASKTVGFKPGKTLKERIK